MFALLATIVGGFLQYKGAQKQQKASMKAETIRKKQMDFEAMRARRQALRESMVARAQAMQGASDQGASFGSAIVGGVSQVSGQAGSNVRAINVGQDLGTQMFKANMDYSKAGGLINLGGLFGTIGGAMDRYGSKMLPQGGTKKG
jgi:hypothetical protein